MLVVEDEPAVGRAVVRALRHAGYHVDVAASHADALSFFDAYDCGVIDIELPDSDGIELAERLAARRIIRSVVFFSGLSDPSVEVRARHQGSFVHKTDGIARLREAIERAVVRA